MKIGILGGGQLARMFAESSKNLGVEIICIDPDPNASASHVMKVHQCVLSDIRRIRKIFADVDCITYETENLSYNQTRQLSQIHQVHPPINALKLTQDRLLEKQLLTSLHIPTTEFYPVNSEKSLKKAAELVGFPCILKTRRNGYDGKGQIKLNNSADINPSWNAMQSKDLILEKFINFDFEVSLISVRSKTGEIKFYPLTRNIHEHGILKSSEAPFINQKLEKEAHHYATIMLEKLNYIGVMTIEFFCINNTLLANEIAPRVHNSGHWTIEGAKTSQFENHLRAIVGLPLGDTNATCYSMMFNCIGEEPVNISRILKTDNVHYHSYNKTARKNRKLGHLTICTESKEKFDSEFKALVSEVF
jgi:5-(carboxyamino)imidazole ribonucleotide synthase